MADQWEMCIVRMDNLGMYTPDKYLSSSNREFNNKHKQKVEIGSGGFREWTICLLLAEGWEPYGSKENEFLFRRKYKA
jgi:hypothetical protein